MLPRDLRFAILSNVGLPGLQIISEYERTVTQAALPDEEYLCSTAMCKWLLKNYYPSDHRVFNYLPNILESMEIRVAPKRPDLQQLILKQCPELQAYVWEKVF
jgi:hypothetical protein